MPITVELCEPRELLALVPFQLGFQPSESLVVVSLRRRDSRVGMVARVDLADLCDPVAGRAVAARLVEHLHADGAAAIVLVVYTHDPSPRRPVPESRPWTATEVLRCAAGLLTVAGVWVVGAAGYHGLGCTDSSCCPDQGRPLHELESTQVGAHMVLSGVSVRASRDELADLPPAPDADRFRAEAAAVAWTRARGAGGSRGPAHLDWLERSLATWRRAVDGEASAAELGQLGAALEDVVLRDAVLVSFVPGTRLLPEQLVRSVRARRADPGTSRATARAVASIVDPEVGVRPDGSTERARLALE